MLKEKIDSLISESMKLKDNNRINVLRLIKTELVKKEKEGKELNDNIESNILMKMLAQRDDSIKQFKDAKRMDLVEKELIEFNIIKEFAPKQASDEDIISETENVIKNMGDKHILSMKDMKFIIGEVQKKYPTANGKIISNVIKSKI